MKNRLALFTGLAALCTGLVLVSCLSFPTSPKNDPVPVLSDNTIDSLFTLLVERVQVVNDVKSYNSFNAIDFGSLATGFNTAVAGSPSNVKANVGCMVANVMALNSSASVKKMVDSLDAYFKEVDTFYNKPVAVTKTLAVTDRGTLSSLYLAKGLQGLGSGLLVAAPQQMLVATQTPTFPRFLKLSYIQDIAQNEVIPALDKAIAAAARLEGLSVMQLLIVFDGDSTIIDKGDICMIDAAAHLVRGMLKMYTTYDYDLYTSATDQTYSWIDSFVDAINQNTLITGKRSYTLSGDTLIYKSITDMASGSYATMASISRYNYSRSGFMTIRHANHASAYADLKAVPVLITQGIAAIRAETDDQAYDLIPRTTMLDWDKDLMDMPQKMIDQGISTTLASNFQSPEALTNFVSQLLAGEYTFRETMNGRLDTLTINLAAWFQNPVTDLRTIMPRYRITTAGQDTARISNDTVTARDYYSQKTLGYYLSDSIKIQIDAARIVRRDTTSYGYVTINFTDSMRYTKSSFQIVSLTPLVYLDSAGNDLSLNIIMQQISSKTFFPYFTDYTMHGIFPNMTRAKWLKLLWR